MDALLLAPALTTALANALLRALLHASRVFSRGESSSRACAALCSALVCLHTLRAGELAGASSYCGYLAADTLGALLLGPALRPEILAHHLGTGALCLLGALRFSERSGAGGALALAAPTAPLARALLLMEVSNPFLHAAWVAQKEEALAGARWAVLPWAVPGALAAFLWFRVLEGARALQYALGLGGALGPWLAPVAGAVGCLLALQVYWYALLCRAVLVAAWPWVAAAASAGKRRA